MSIPHRIAVIGATSAIAQEVLKKYVSKETSFVLCVRSPEKGAVLSQDLLTRGAARADVLSFEAENISSHAALIADCWRLLGTVDLLLIAHGDMPQDGSKETPEQVLQTWAVNGTAVISLASQARSFFETQAQGCLCVISSVAGERGRRPTYVYGAAKAGVTGFCQALRQVLAPKNVRVITIKPGFVDTPMTAHLSKSPLFASAERVATTIVRVINNGTNREVMVPWFWNVIMTIIKLLPERLFLKLKI